MTAQRLIHIPASSRGGTDWLNDDPQWMVVAMANHGKAIKQRDQWTANGRIQFMELSLDSVSVIRGIIIIKPPVQRDQGRRSGGQRNHVMSNSVPYCPRPIDDVHYIRKKRRFCHHDHWSSLFLCVVKKEMRCSIAFFCVVRRPTHVERDRERSAVVVVLHPSISLSTGTTSCFRRRVCNHSQSREASHSLSQSSVEEEDRTA